MLWRDVRLHALTDAPEEFGSSVAEWAEADESRWRQRLIDVPFNVVALVDGDAVGQASGTAIGDDHRAELISMWVAPQVRGTGVALDLIEAVVSWATTAGASKLRLSVRRANQRAIRCYLRAGFKHTDEPGDDEAELAMVLAL